MEQFSYSYLKGSNFIQAVQQRWLAVPCFADMFPVVHHIESKTQFVKQSENKASHCKSIVFANVQ